MMLIDIHMHLITYNGLDVSVLCSRINPLDSRTTFLQNLVLHVGK